MKRGETGRYEITAVGGEQVRAFVPDPLPPVPVLATDEGLAPLPEAATLALDRLDGVSALCRTRRFPLRLRPEGGGRLLIAFHLCHAGVLREPLLYLSLYLGQRLQQADLPHGRADRAPVQIASRALLDLRAQAAQEDVEAALRLHGCGKGSVGLAESG